jgi:hypothetical protein
MACPNNVPLFVVNFHNSPPCNPCKRWPRVATAHEGFTEPPCCEPKGMYLGTSPTCHPGMVCRPYCPVNTRSAILP